MTWPARWASRSCPTEDWSSLRTASCELTDTCRRHAVLVVCQHDDVVPDLADRQRPRPQCGDRRGLGPRPSRERDAGPARKLVYRAWQLGAVIFYVGSNVLEVTPLLTISDEQVDLAAEIATGAINDVVVGAISDGMDAPYAGWQAHPTVVTPRTGEQY